MDYAQAYVEFQTQKAEQKGRFTGEQLKAEYLKQKNEPLPWWW